MNHTEILSKTILFRDLPESVLGQLGEIAVAETADSHEEIFREGSAGEDMFVVALGSVKMFVRNESGDNEELGMLGTGSYFGDMALVSDKHVRVSSATAMEKTTLLRIRREDVERLVEADPKFAGAFYKAVAKGLVRRLNSSDHQLANYRAYWRQHHRGHS